jgi:hypothetical protein
MKPNEKLELHHRLLIGDGKDLGVIPILRQLVVDVHGVDGKGGLARAEEANTRFRLGAKAWMAGAAFVGGMSAGLVFWLLENFVMHHK